MSDLQDKSTGLEEALRRIEDAKRTNAISLDLSDLALSHIPDSLAAIVKLLDVNISNNQITAIPDSISQLSNLEKLNLKGNQISVLPDSLSELAGLQELKLRDNLITAIPDSIAQLTRLRELDLSENLITAIPDSLAKLANLQKLDLGGNGITFIPDSLAELASLNELGLSSNEISSIPDSLGSLSSLKHLNLWNNRINSLPDSLAQLDNLHYLDLNVNRLVTIPDALCKLHKLELLGLKKNQLCSIPDSLAQLVNLGNLDLSDNQISSIPESLGQLVNLWLLDLYGNQISVLPESIVNLVKLRQLDLSNNLIMMIPESITHLVNLEKLDLSANKITSIPELIVRLVNLQTLNLRRNQITSVPVFLVRLANLAMLLLDGNPLSDELFAALNQGVPSFFRYLQSTAKRKVYPRTVKLVLLGEPKSGKTTLLEALRGNQQPCDKSRKETLGVNVVTIEKPHPSDHQAMYLSAWDFAGQHMEHATHQFFLTENAIYLILWNARQGAASGKHDLWYWLELLKMRVREPKFLLVATHTEYTPPDLNLSDIESSYPGCQGHFPVELCSLKGVSSLETKILELAAASPSMRAPWPPEWRDVRDEVRNIRKQQPYMTPENFHAFMKENGVIGEQAQKDLSGQLHHLGEILYFQERDELSGLVILNPEWVTELIALVVRSKQVREHNGILRKTDLEELWAHAGLKPEVRDHLIHLMDWFDLTYSTGHKTDLGIVVEALPYSKPEDLKEIDLPPNGPQMEMIFRFPSLQRHLPPGIPTWGMARAHRYSKRTPWRDAAAFGDDVTKSQAIILASDAKKEVRLRVAADFPPFFFGQLQAILLDTFKRYPGAVPELRFPCPCRPGCSTSYLSETVMKRWRDNKDVYCDLSGEDVAVASLLNGVQRRPVTAEGRLALQSEIRRQFTALRHAQNQQMEKNCPSVFTLVPSKDFKQLDAWLESVTQGEELELAVYCEHDSGWHPTAYSLYRFKPDQEWFDLVKKSWNKLVAVTKYVGPLAKAIGKASKLVALEVGGMAAEKLPEASRSIAGSLSAELRGKDEPEAIDIEVRHLLERLIKYLDSKRPPLEPNNGGLHRHIIDDGRLLWLCPEHKKLYQPRA